MRNITKKTKAVLAGSLVLVAVGGGVAYAYWSTTGTGSGTAAVSAGASNLSITQNSAPTNLAPGVAAGAISGTVKNNSANNAFVHTVTVSIASVATAPGAVGTCDASDYTLSGATMTVDQDLATGASTGFSGATLGFNNKATNQDGCKGATVNLAYSSN
ncbi:hypothetical protein ATK30_8161 [Amycolatopsis echigonensis]|uniref:Camelysin-like metallo-endopeptidase n=1 Tax=Amycolatopsis echigonensis TaxID=2576905 RepID=A0A2N3WTI2_9PSEU|nr:hypothetical protein [Amycolatopsis niigatensis]PKV97189.1 hypothetical protein ATK30_8161 [Amycolatopsis niigatensis]